MKKLICAALVAAMLMVGCETLSFINDEGEAVETTSPNLTQAQALFTLILSNVVELATAIRELDRDEELSEVERALALQEIRQRQELITWARGLILQVIQDNLTGAEADEIFKRIEVRFEDNNISLK